MTQLGASYAVPESVLPYVGQIMDVDAHESTPMNRWADYFGTVVADMVDAVSQSQLAAATVSRAHDDTAINATTVWHEKSCNAPGSFDFARRLDVMDLTGVRRQMIFPGSMGLLALGLYASANDPSVFKTITTGRREYARKLLDAYNDYCFRVAKQSDRLRPVAMLIGETVDELVQEAKTLLRNGIRAVWMPSATPPAGLSPADPALDPLWDVLAAGKTPVLAHIGDGASFLNTLVWRNAPAFEGYRVGGEFSLDPWTLTNFHLGAQNLVATMVMGCVFDRHPNLRLGCAELGAGWIGPLADNMDLWNDNSRTMGQIGVPLMRLKNKPSDYVRRNIRVAAFEVEDVGTYIDRYGLGEVYCYASDFPHIEGGKAPMARFSNSIARLGEGTMRKFFVENGRWLLPD